ncbi:MAG: TIGR00303 family protein [Candidatus Freyarchaeota archaeon]|nr:TIGR00303 family protein [Candidatus Jordarchaeia archaeon]
MAWEKDVLLVHNEAGARGFLRDLEGGEPVFVCVIGNTETAKIPGISAAGRNPELTDYTPAADVELLLYGECRCIDGVPVTPEGIPTPALITRAALTLADIPVFVVNGGVRVKPLAPFIDVAGNPGADIRTGRAVEGVARVIERAEIAGASFAKAVDYLVVGESIPGGTTTALGVLLAMGVNARGLVSSSMPVNPHELKVRVVEEGLRAAGVKPGDLSGDPVAAVSAVGDPMIAAFAGFVMGAASSKPVVMAGGTQMTAVLSVIKGLKPEVLDNVAIGTTRWIAQDRSSDVRRLVSQIWDVPVVAANLDFSGSQIEGLRAYESGVVKEGVGAGGVTVAATLKTDGKVACDDVRRKVEEEYGRLITMRLQQHSTRIHAT